MTKQLDIGIAGAGIGGLALAAALARNGHRVHIFDQFDAPAPVGSGLVVQPVGQEVLEGLGAGTAAEALGNRVHRMFGHDARHGRPVLDVSYDAPGQPRYGLAMHRSALFQVLLDVARDAGAELRPGAHVEGVSERSFTLGSRREGPFDLLVDATGAGSKLTPMQSRPLDYGALWATVDWPQTNLPRNELRQCYRRADRMLGVLPIGQLAGGSAAKAAIFWSLPTDSHDAWRRNGLTAWKDEAVALWPEFAPFVAQITAREQMVMARYAHGTLKRPWAGDVVFIGDAAHRASPQLGQGANMALLDAWALAEALREARGDVPLAVSWYGQWRRWHVRAYQLMSWLFTPQYQSDSVALPWLRDRVLFPISVRGPLPRILTRLVCGDLLPPLAR